MATPFATASDLALRLKVPLWIGADLEHVEQHLADASTDLRAEIGWQVYPPVKVTIEAHPDSSGLVRLPGAPITSLTSVTVGGQALPADRYTWAGDSLRLYAWGQASITYMVGYEAPPDELAKWTCVLAAQSLARAASEGLGATPSSEALGADYRVSYSDQQQSGELPIPARVLDRLRSTYGQSVFVA